MTALEQLFGPEVASSFLTEHWMRRHLAGHGPISRLPDLAAASERLTDVGQFLSGHGGPVTAYLIGEGDEVRELEVQPQQAGTLLDAGFCVHVQELASRFPQAARWAHGLARELGMPKRGLRISAFVAPPGGQLRKHFDAVHGFSIQLKGLKTWHVAPNVDITEPTEGHNPPGWLHPDLRAAGGAPMDPVMPPEAEAHTLRSGSVLFFPRGTWHATETHEFSVSLSVGFEPPVWADVVVHALRAHLIADPRWRRSASVGRGDSERRAAAEAALTDLLADLPAHIGDLRAGDLLDILDEP